MRARIGGKVDRFAVAEAGGHHRGYAHVEVGAGLALRTHPGKAIHQSRNNVLARAVDDLGALGNRHIRTRPNLCDAAIAHNDGGVLQILCRMAPVANVNDRATGENQRDRSRGAGRNRKWQLRPGKHTGQNRTTGAQ